LDGAGNETPAKTIVAPGETFKLRVSVVGTIDQGTWEIPLLNQGAQFGTLKVLNAPVTFDVKPEIEDAANVELKFGRDRKTVITIKNDDTASYTLDCVYAIGIVSAPCQPEHAEKEHAQGQKTNLPVPFKVSTKSSTVVFVDPDHQWFESPRTSSWWDKAGFASEALRDLISDHTREGRLTIRLRSANCDSDPAAPVKTFKFKSRLSSHSEEARAVWSSVIVFLMLFAGAMLSVLANLLLPGTARRLKLQEELAVVSGKVNDLSMDLESRLRVPLGVERTRLARRLMALKTVSPDFSTAITEIEKNVAGLKARLDILGKLELALRRYWKMRREGRLPMSLTQQIEDIRQQTTDVLARSEPNDADLQNAQLLIQEIEKRIANLDQPNPAFAQQLVLRFQKLQAAMTIAAINGSATLSEMRKRLPDLFAKLQTTLPKAEEIKPADYMELDTAVFQLEIVSRHDALVKNPVDQIQTDRLAEHGPELVRLLHQPGWDPLNRAQALIQQLEENVFPEDVARAVEDHQVEIEVDRNLVYQFESVGFRLFFLKKEISSSTARREFTIKWDFGHDNLTERGGWVSHYFPYATVLSTIMPWRRIIARLVLWLSLAYVAAGLPLAAMIGHAAADTLFVVLSVIVIALTPLSRRFRFAIKKAQQPGANAREVDPQYLRAPYLLKAFLVKPDGMLLPQSVEKTLEAYQTPRTGLPAAFWVEATRFSIALLIALVGLVAGAKEQLLKLDVFPALAAIFMIGFGANEVKKLFTQSS
jgi:hypothetical protein